MNSFHRFLEQCITDCIEGNGPDADLHRAARDAQALCAHQRFWAGKDANGQDVYRCEKCQEVLS